MEEIKKDQLFYSELELRQVYEALQVQRKTWRDICQTLDQKKLDRSIPKKSPKKIILIGEGSSLFAAKLTALTLIRGGIDAPVAACSSINLGREVVAEKGDWVFGFSHRGRTTTTLKSFKLARKSGAFPIWVTGINGFESPDAHLVLTTCEQEKCEPHTVAMTSPICAVTTLLLGRKARDRWTQLSRELDPDLTHIRQQIGSGPTLLLGEWEGEWIAREIRLKLLEMAQLRAAVFSSEEFFHGPQLFSTKNKNSERIWYVSLQGDQRAQKIHDEFQNAYVQVAVQEKRLLAWVSALVRLQWMSLGVALNLKGISL